jgi:sulfatase modifying factor 1
MNVYKLPFIGNKSGFGFIALWPYLPSRYTAPEKFSEVRDKILAFKGGFGSTAIASEFISKSYMLKQNLGELAEWTLAVIPASNQIKTECRFKAFANLLSLNLGFNNGFDLIRAEGDRAERKLQQDRDSVNILNHLNFPQSIKGKKIILFDDVLTTGKSFELIAFKLMELGAEDVFGLFLSKTVWPTENSIDFEFSPNGDKRAITQMGLFETLEAKTNSPKILYPFSSKIFAPGNFRTGVYSKNGVNIDWIELPKGYFFRGDNGNKIGLSTSNKDYKPPNLVMVDSFKIALTTITFEQYDKMCTLISKEKPSDNSWGRGDFPVININWYEANFFANWLGCRLPTETEWEYACRAGTQTAFNNGSNYLIDANFNSNRTKPVGLSGRNDWSLYGMHGNVWEWCSDWFDYYSKTEFENPKGPEKGFYKIIRGGSYLSPMPLCSSYFRANNRPEFRSCGIGFRVVVP